MKAINTPAIITGIRAKVDGSLGLSISTPEMTPEQKVLFMQLQNLNVDMLINPLESENVEIERIDKEIETKTPSQRLRAVLFLWWKKEGGQGLFEEFYRLNMEKLIDYVKKKLD